MNNERIVKRAQIDGEFTGFDGESLFILMDRTYWVQDEYKYWYHYAYCPQIELVVKAGRTYIRVAGQSESVAVREIYDVTKSRIEGEFKGWEGDTTYELANGQVWQQSAYKYTYKHAHRPEAVVYNPGSGHVMAVAGTTATVRRVR